MATKTIHKGIARDDAFNRQMGKLEDVIDSLDNLVKEYQQDSQTPVNSQIFNLRRAMHNLEYVTTEMEDLQKRLRQKS